MFLRSKSLGKGFQPSKITHGKCRVSKVQIKAFGTEAEERIAGILKKSLNTSEVKVLDTSNGCGAMYDIEVSATEFQGKSLVQQHMRINDVLKDEIKNMHGLRIKTKPLTN